MSLLAWAGLALTALALALVGWCALRAARISKAGLSDEAAAAEMRRVITLNGIAMVVAVFGLGLLLLGLLF